MTPVVEESAKMTVPIAAASVPALARGDIAGLDGLRAVSALMVMVSHFGFQRIVPGGLGVTIFFFISGFLITTLMLREARATGTVAIGYFYIRRLLRLQPELWAFLILSSLLGALYGAWPRIVDVVCALLYVTNYLDGGAIIGDQSGQLRWLLLWSLAVEEHYYLTFPLLVAWLIKVPMHLLYALVAVLVVCLVLRCTYVMIGVSSDYIYDATETRIDSIVYGCVTALSLWLLPERFHSRLDRLGGLIGALGLALMLVSIVIRAPMIRDTLRYSAQGVALAMMVTALYTSAIGARVIRWLDVAPLKWLGRMSYGAYLWHIEVGTALHHLAGIPWVDEPSLGMALSAVVFSIASFCVAWVSWALLQKPLTGLRHRFGHVPPVRIGVGF